MKNHGLTKNLSASLAESAFYGILYSTKTLHIDRKLPEKDRSFTEWYGKELT
jgi:hypothetical protein